MRWWLVCVGIGGQVRLALVVGPCWLRRPFARPKGWVVLALGSFGGSTLLSLEDKSKV